MNFITLYTRILNNVFPDIYTLDRSIPTNVFKTYYLMHNKKLDGSSFSLNPDEIVIRDRNTSECEYFEAFFDDILMKCHVIPYHINKDIFKPEDRARVLYKLFSNIIMVSKYEVYSHEMCEVFLHAPFALTLIMLNEVEPAVNHRDLCKIINNEFIQEYNEELCTEILDIGLENLLQYGALYSVMEKYKPVIEVDLDDLRTI